jgi:hypothetical protein
MLSKGKAKHCLSLTYPDMVDLDYVLYNPNGANWKTIHMIHRAHALHLALFYHGQSFEDINKAFLAKQHKAKRRYHRQAAPPFPEPEDPITTFLVV